MLLQLTSQRCVYAVHFAIYRRLVSLDLLVIFAPGIPWDPPALRDKAAYDVVNEPRIIRPSFVSPHRSKEKPSLPTSAFLLETHGNFAFNETRAGTLLLSPSFDFFLPPLFREAPGYSRYFPRTRVDSIDSSILVILIFLVSIPIPFR